MNSVFIYKFLIVTITISFVAVIIVLVIRQREISSHRHDTNPVCERGCVVFLYIGTVTVPKATDDALCDGMKGLSLRQATVMVKPTDRTQRNPNPVKKRLSWQDTSICLLRIKI